MATDDIMQMAMLSKVLGGSNTKSNISTLFGLDPDIVSAQQAQQQLQGSRNEAMQYAQLDPYQRANYMMYQGGSGLAGGLMGALGPDTAAVTRAKKMQELNQALIDSGINMNTPEGQQQGAVVAANMGLRDVAIELNNNAVNMASTMAKTKKELEPGSVEERGRSYLVSIEDALAQGKPVAPAAIQQAALITQSMTKPEVRMGPDGTMVTVTPESPLGKLPSLAKVLQTQYAPQQAPQGAQSTLPQQGTQQLAPGVTSMQVAPPKIDASVRKDIADTDKLIVSADKTYSEMNKLTQEIKGLDVSLARNVGRGVEAQLGLNSKDQITIDKMKRFIERNRNEILNQATGVQAKDDAERILNEVFGDETIWRNPTRLQAAWSSLMDMSKNNAEGLRTKRQVLVPEGANVGAAPQAPKASQRPATSRTDAFDKMKAANPNASEASINKWLDGRGY